MWYRDKFVDKFIYNLEILLRMNFSFYRCIGKVGVKFDNFFYKLTGDG